MIIGNYTDIVVIILYIFCDLKIDQLWIEYGCGKNCRWLPIHNYVKLLGEENYRASPFWYALTGCDTVSSFCGRRKKTAWDAWSCFAEVTQYFLKYLYMMQLFFLNSILRIT